MTARVAYDKDEQHAANLAKLPAAKAKEKEARRLRREGRDQEAIELYDRARDLYADTNLVYHEHGDSELAREVLGAIKRCDAILSNIRHPKTKRPSAITPRPNCLTCDKPLRRYKRDGLMFNDGTPQEWGDYGDNRFCGLTCGWRWACRNSSLPTTLPKKAKK